MTFGATQSQPNYNPAITAPPAYTPQKADSTVLLAGLMGLRPKQNPAISTSFATGSSPGLGRRPSLLKRVNLGGA